MLTHIIKRGIRHAIFIYYNMYRNYVFFSICYWVQDWLYLSFNFVSQPGSYIVSVLRVSVENQMRFPSVLVSHDGPSHSYDRESAIKFYLHASNVSWTEKYWTTPTSLLCGFINTQKGHDASFARENWSTDNASQRYIELQL